MERIAYYDQGIFDVHQMKEWSIPQIVRLKIDYSTKSSRIALYHNAHASLFQIHCSVPTHCLIESMKCFTNQRLLFTTTGINMLISGPQILENQSILCKETSHILITWSGFLVHYLDEKYNSTCDVASGMPLTSFSQSIIRSFLRPTIDVNVTYQSVFPHNPILKSIAMVRVQYEIPISGSQGSLINRIKGEYIDGMESIMIWIVVMDAKGQMFQPLERVELVGPCDIVLWPLHMLKDKFYHFRNERQQRTNIWESVEYFDMHMYIDRIQYTQAFTCFVLIQY